jgi:hypothetical protein
MIECMHWPLLYSSQTIVYWPTSPDDWDLITDEQMEQNLAAACSDVHGYYCKAGAAVGLGWTDNSTGATSTASGSVVSAALH